MWEKAYGDFAYMQEDMMGFQCLHWKDENKHISVTTQAEWLHW